MFSGSVKCLRRMRLSLRRRYVVIHDSVAGACLSLTRANASCDSRSGCLERRSPLLGLTSIRAGTRPVTTYHMRAKRWVQTPVTNAPHLCGRSLAGDPRSFRARPPSMLTMHRPPLRATTCSRFPGVGFELHPLRDQPVLQVAPQRNGQTPCERHNADAPQALATTGEASVKPLAQFTLRLVAQPAPSELHHQSTHPAIAGLGNALLGFALAAGVGRGRQPETARPFAPVAKAPPPKQLLRQPPAAAHPDPA